MSRNTSHGAQPGWRFLRSRRWIGYYALIVVFSIACVLLGNWQFDRRDEARAEIDRIDNNYDAVPVTIDEALPALDSFDLDANKWQQVQVTGTYEGLPYLVRNRASAQGVGSTLLHPLRLTNGSVLFVDRGWIDVNAADGVPEALPMPAGGTVEVIVRLRESEVPLAGREHLGRTLATIHLPDLQTMVSGPAYTGAYGQVVIEQPSGETGQLPTKPERDEGPHLSYALQWYVFILIVIIGAWYAATLEHRSLNARTEADMRKQARKAERKRSRGPTDAEEEDALLDSTV